MHVLSGNALQLFLPCMKRLECRHDVFHALGNARDRRDGERVSFFMNSPHIARKVEGTTRRQKGLRQQFGDAGHASSTMHIASETKVKPFDLTPQILKKRSRRSEGGQILQELNSILEGKYWDDAKGGWLDPVLVRQAREEEMQCEKKHAVYEKVPREPVLERDGEEPHQDRLGGHKLGNVPVSEHKILLGGEGLPHWTQMRLVQCNVPSVRGEDRHLGSSVKQPERDSALLRSTVMMSPSRLRGKTLSG